MSLLHLAVALTVVSLTLYATMMALFARGMVVRSRQRYGTKKDLPPRVTVFKPMAGRDDDLEDNLESFARIDYPRFELLFGVASASDPACAVARRFIARHPELDARLVLTDPHAATNPKVAQLVGLEREARGEVYVVSDSNVRVGARYLWSLVGELADERVGMVTSLFSGTGERSVGAALENLQICAYTSPGLVALDQVTDRPLTVGKSMAVRKRDLVRLGGFLPVGEVLAEDYALGRRFFEAGFRAKTSLDTVENRNVECSVKHTVDRHTRWSKMRRCLQPMPFSVEPIMTPIVVASGSFLLAPDRVTAAMLAVACLVQTAAANVAVRAIRGTWLPPRYIPLEVVRSYVTLFCWARACVSRRIEWRGHQFTMRRGTEIVPVGPPSERSASRARLAA